MKNFVFFTSILPVAAHEKELLERFLNRYPGIGRGTEEAERVQGIFALGGDGS
jgi:hypothetical protein